MISLQNILILLKPGIFQIKNLIRSIPKILINYLSIKKPKRLLEDIKIVRLLKEKLK